MFTIRVNIYYIYSCFLCWWQHCKDEEDAQPSMEWPPKPKLMPAQGKGFGKGKGIWDTF